MTGLSRAFGRRRVLSIAIVALAAAAMIPAGEALAAPPQEDCDARSNNTYPKILECVRLDQVRAHQAALQAIANANGGTRAAGTPGYEASGEYVEDQLAAAGYLVSRQEFTYEQFILNSTAMEQTAPVPTVYVEGTDFAAMDYSGSDDVTAPVQVIDVNLAGDRLGTSGCEDADFAGFTPGNIALIQRGT
jgi:hypothetical protein